MSATHDAEAPDRPVTQEVARRVEELMRLPYRKVIQGDSSEGFLAHVPELPGCVTAGETEDEALALLRDAMALWLTVAVEQGDRIPEPTSPSLEYGGKVLVRMPKSLHRRLAERAEEEGVSINQLAVATLARGLG